MKNIINYIKFGRGIGARWLFLYAIIVAIVLGISVKTVGYYATPTLQNVADQLLPIKVENGVVHLAHDFLTACENPCLMMKER